MFARHLRFKAHPLMICGMNPCDEENESACENLLFDRPPQLVIVWHVPQVEEAPHRQALFLYRPFAKQSMRREREDAIRVVLSVVRMKRS